MHDRDWKMLSRARRAYEFGRLILALRAALVALATVGLAVALGAPNTLTLLAGGAVVLATGFCASYGKRTASAAHLALVGGVAAVVGVLAVRMGASCPKSFCEEACLVSCLSGGFAGGALVLGWCVMRRLEPTALGAAFFLVGLAASLGAAFAQSGICAVLASATGLALAAVILPLLRSDAVT